MGIEQGIIQLSIALIPVLLGIICHELAHGYVAYLLGDPTAKLQGRLTFNPLPHIDVVGAMMFILSSLFTPFSIGWAKPIPVDSRYFLNIRKSLLWIALAGPIANLIIACVFALSLKMVIVYDTISSSEMTTTRIFIYSMLQMGIFINVLLAVFNMLPIPPLDGSRVIAYFLPRTLAYRYESLERFGFLFLLFLVVFNVLRIIILPISTNIVMFILRIFSLG